MTHPLGAPQFEALLRQLGPDREQAAVRYEELRRRLITVFAYRHCHNPEDLADETLDRVARKLLDNAVSPEGTDPSPFVFGVAWNVARESFRGPRTVVLPERWDPPDPAVPADTVERQEREQECLDRCLRRLAPTDRDLVLKYFRAEKRAKINERSLLARQLQVTLNALRLKIHRITVALRTCVFACVDASGPGPREMASGS
jgi:DNA-directed RNA polymerase specialized sigma24 family protein